MTAKKRFDPEPMNPVQARQCIAIGVSWFFAHKPLAMWPILALFLGTNGTAWYKALFSDTVTIEPVGDRSSLVIMPEAIAATPESVSGEVPFEVDTAWTILKWKDRYAIRVWNPRKQAFDVEMPAMSKMYEAGKK